MKHNRLKERLGAIIEEALAKEVASSISLFVGFSATDTPLDMDLHAGLTSREPRLLATSENTIYDLASLTKIIGTSTAMAHALAQKKIDLPEIPFSSWPHTSTRALLAHTAGLPAHKRFFEEIELSNDDFLANKVLIKSTLLEVPAYEQADRLYSDLGYMALGFLLEERFNKPLFEVFCEAWAALGLQLEFLWYPSHSPARKSSDLNVAETFSFERNVGLLAQVHDGNAYFLGGLAGHAGLFGTQKAVKAFGQLLLVAYQNPQNVTQNILADFARNRLGFDKPSPDGSNKFLSPNSFGHFGYTGTSLWVDPAYGKHGLIVALLTNRIKMTDQPEGIFWLRSAVHEAVMLE